MSEIVLGRSRFRMDTDAETTMATEAWKSLKKEVGVEEATSFLNECSTVFGQREFNAFEFGVCCDLIMRFNAIKSKKKKGANEEMSEFEKRTIDLTGGLKVSVDSEEEETEFIDSLRAVTEKNGPWTTRFLYAWSEAFGAEIKGDCFCFLAVSEFLPKMTLEDVKRHNLRSLKRIFDDEGEMKRELERRMNHYIQTSEGVIWIGSWLSRFEDKEKR